MRQFIVLVITPQRWRRRTKGAHGELWEKMPGEQTTRTPSACIEPSVTAHRRRSVFHRSPLRRLYMYTARDERNTDHKIILLSCDRIVRGTYEVDWQTCAILYSMQWRAMRQGFLTAWTAHPRPAAYTRQCWRHLSHTKQFQLYRIRISWSEKSNTVLMFVSFYKTWRVQIGLHSYDKLL